MPGSTFERSASASASATASIVEATTSWLQAFAIWPAPDAPTCTIVPEARSGHRTLDVLVTAPDHDREGGLVAPLLAPGDEARRPYRPLPPRILASRLLAIGSIVLMSMRATQVGCPSITALAESTSSTSGVSGSIVIARSRPPPPRPSSRTRGPPRRPAPRPDLGIGEWTASGNPASSRCRAIERPMIPRPMKPTASVTTRPRPGRPSRIRRRRSTRRSRRWHRSAGTPGRRTRRTRCGRSRRRVGDLAGAGLVPVGRVGDLNVTDPGPSASMVPPRSPDDRWRWYVSHWNRRCELPTSSRSRSTTAIDPTKNPGVSFVFSSSTRSRPSRPQALGCVAQVLDDAVELALPRDRTDLDADQAVHLPAVEDVGVAERSLDAVPELLAPRRVVRETALPGVEVAGGEVEEVLPEAVRPQPPLEVVGIEVIAETCTRPRRTPPPPPRRTDRGTGARSTGS